MCEGFGMIVSKDMKGYFTTPNSDGDMSHSDILSALDWKDNTDAHLRNFVRVQCPNWTMKSFEFDEDSTLPGWAEENRDEIREIVKKALRRCAPAMAEYEKVRDAAMAEYEKVCAPAWAEYKKVRDAAMAEYEKVRAPAMAEYDKVRDAAMAEYEKVRDAAMAEYEKVRDAAWARFIDRLSKVAGFVAPK